MGTARDKLIKLLQDHSIHQDVTTHLTDVLGMQSLDDLATTVEDRSELKARYSTELRGESGAKCGGQLRGSSSA